MELRQRFHLEINSIEDLAAFVALIRGEDLTKLQEMTARLSGATQALSDAERADDAGNS